MCLDLESLLLEDRRDRLVDDEFELDSTITVHARPGAKSPARNAATGPSTLS
jgi:hypothetical protein